MKLFVFSFLFAALIFIATAGPIGDCWNQWSRCSKWSSGGTDVLWQNCDYHCKCKGYSGGGQCVLVPAECKLSDEAYQCKCNGAKGEPSGSFCGV